MTNNTEILRTEGLKRSYLVNETKIDVLKGINLTINNQEFIAIMGKSGSGKTTLKIIRTAGPADGRKSLF